MVGSDLKMNQLYHRQKKISFDLSLILNVSALLLFGLLIVYDASIIQAAADYKDSYFYIKQQLIWVFLGILAAAFFANFNYHNFRKLSKLILFGSVILLLAVFIPGLGTKAGGAHRWINLGFFTLQPAELFKLAAVIWSAYIFENKAKFKPMIGLVIVGVFILGLLQKDLGSAIVFSATVGIIYIISGGPLWQILSAIPLGIAGILALTLTSDYRMKRISAFLDPFSDTQGFTYHISQVLIALGSGGMFGVGLGQSRQKFYIPEVTTDSIFAIIGEELGFLGALFLILLFGFLIVKGFKIAEAAPDRFGQILAAGITVWLGVQAIINLGSMVALFPLTGVPLPFISYGGSALVANLAAIGILLNISKATR